MKDLNSVIIEGTVEKVADNGKSVTIRSEGVKVNSFRAVSEGKIAEYIYHKGAFVTKVRIAGQLDTDRDGMLIKIEHIEFMDDLTCTYDKPICSGEE
jgi:hypothetical protein